MFSKEKYVLRVDLSNKTQTHDITSIDADTLRLKAKAENTGVRFKFFEYEGMQHDWMLFPIPERQKVIEEVCDFIAAK